MERNKESKNRAEKLTKVDTVEDPKKCSSKEKAW